MPDDIRYAAYPCAKVFDAAGNQVQHVLWGDWVNVTGDLANPHYVEGFGPERELRMQVLGPVPELVPRQGRRR